MMKTAKFRKQTYGTPSVVLTACIEFAITFSSFLGLPRDTVQGVQGERSGEVAVGIWVVRLERRWSHNENRNGRRSHQHLRNARQSDTPPRGRHICEGARRENISRKKGLSYTSQSIVDDLFQLIDTNKDGVISIEELVQWCSRNEHILKSLDTLDTVL